MTRTISKTKVKECDNRERERKVVKRNPRSSAMSHMVQPHSHHHYRCPIIMAFVLASPSSMATVSSRHKAMTLVHGSTQIPVVIVTPCSGHRSQRLLMVVWFYLLQHHLLTCLSYCSSNLHKEQLFLGNAFKLWL